MDAWWLALKDVCTGSWSVIVLIAGVVILLIPRKRVRR